MKLSREEFERLALEQLDMLYRLARRLVRGDTAKAEDLVQETYLRALKAREGFDLNEGYGIRPWLIRIMHNLHVSRAEREKRQPQAADDQHLEAAAGGAGDSASSNLPPLDPASFEGMDDQLVRALNTLPPEYQSVLTLWAIDDFSYKEIAAALDIPIGTVMSRLYRARHQLSDQLRDYATKEGMIRE